MYYGSYEGDLKMPELGYGAEELWLLYELYGLVGQVLS